MIIRDRYRITGDLYNEAIDYAEKSKYYTSNRHDFHNGGYDNKKKKMFEGKLGEKAFKIFLLENNANFIEDCSSCDERDDYDFLLCHNSIQYKIDVKTRTENFHTRTMEMVEQAQSHPKDIYIAARLYRESDEVALLGWFTFKDMININRIENKGYLDNYVMFDNELRPMSEFDCYL